MKCRIFLVFRLCLVCSHRIMVGLGREPTWILTWRDGECLDGRLHKRLVMLLRLCAAPANVKLNWHLKNSTGRLSCLMETYANEHGQRGNKSARVHQHGELSSAVTRTNLHNQTGTCLAVVQTFANAMVEYAGDWCLVATHIPFVWVN